VHAREKRDGAPAHRYVLLAEQTVFLGPSFQPIHKTSCGDAACSGSNLAAQHVALRCNPLNICPCRATTVVGSDVLLTPQASPVAISLSL
jgi:hypothetical protein